MINSLAAARFMTLNRSAHLRVIFNKMPFILRRTFNRSAAFLNTENESVNITYIEGDGREVHVKAPLGKSLLDVAHENDIELEGACGGELACSTCHIIFSQDIYDKLPKKAEEEDDMLDLAWGLTATSRLGCQIKVTKDLEDAILKIPEDPIGKPQ